MVQAGGDVVARPVHEGRDVTVPGLIRFHERHRGQQSNVQDERHEKQNEELFT